MFTLTSITLIFWLFSDEARKMNHEGNRRRTLGEQALFLVNVADRLTALRRTTAAMQVALARAIVLQALSSVAVRYVLILENSCSTN